MLSSGGSGGRGQLLWQDITGAFIFLNVLNPHVFRKHLGECWRRLRLQLSAVSTAAPPHVDFHHKYFNWFQRRVCVCVCGHLDSDNTTAETSNVLSPKSAFTQHILASVLTCVSWP